MSKATKRPYTEVLPVAQHVVDILSPFCERIEIAGSLRRERRMIGDVEIVALPKRQTNLFGEAAPAQVTQLDIFLNSKVENFRVNGRKLKSWQHGPVQVDLFLPESPAHWGSIFTIRTGSHEFNMWLMNVASPAAEVKFKDGLLYTWNMGLISTPEESDVFKALRLPFIPANMRDDQKWLEVTNRVKT